MPGIFSTFNVLKRALGANQYALNTTSHNIANANTEGYSRQRVTLEASRAEGVTSLNSASGPGQLGTGVDVSEITRARDTFLDIQIRNENSTLGRYTAREQFLSEIETIFMEPSDNGLSKAMGQMWNSWQELSRGPENSTLRNGAVESSIVVTDMLNHTYAQLESLELNSDTLTRGQVFEFNQTIKQVEDINEQIRGVKLSGSNPNDLLDKQDVLIDKLSEMMNISVRRGSLDEAIISANGVSIVGLEKQNLSFIKEVKYNDTSKKTEITYYEKGDSISGQKSVTIDDADGSFYNSIKDDKVLWNEGTKVTKANIGDGSILGNASIYTEINEYKSQLDALAKSIAYAVNTVHNDGGTPQDSGYVAFFTTKDGYDNGAISAKNITVNPSIVKDITLIKTNGKKSVGPPVEYYPENNGDRALAIAQLRDARLYMNEMLESNTTIESGVFDPAAELGFTGKLIISGSDRTQEFTIEAGDTLEDIAEKINTYEEDVPYESQRLFVKAEVVGGKLTIKSVKSDDNSIGINDSVDGKLLRDLKITDQRFENSIVGNYDESNTSMNIKEDTKGTTLGNYFQDTIAKLGSSARQAENIVTSQEALINQLDVRKESISGVSMDEEMADMIQYQRAYEAAARMMSTMDELLDVLINRMMS